MLHPHRIVTTALKVQKLGFRLIQHQLQTSQVISLTTFWGWQSQTFITETRRRLLDFASRRFKCAAARESTAFHVRLLRKGGNRLICLELEHSAPADQAFGLRPSDFSAISR